MRAAPVRPQRAFAQKSRRRVSKLSALPRAKCINMGFATSSARRASDRLTACPSGAAALSDTGGSVVIYSPAVLAASRPPAGWPSDASASFAGSTGGFCLLFRLHSHSAAPLALFLFRNVFRRSLEIPAPAPERMCPFALHSCTVSSDPVKNFSSRAAIEEAALRNTERIDVCAHDRIVFGSKRKARKLRQGGKRKGTLNFPRPPRHVPQCPGQEHIQACRDTPHRNTRLPRR